MKHLKRLFVIFASAALVFAAGCQNAQAASTTVAAETSGTTTVTAMSAVSTAKTLSADAYTERDLDESYDASEAVFVDLSMASGDYTITSEGVYVFSGTLSNGSILVNAGENDKVQIVLSNASITNSDGPAIYAVTADKVFITAEAGTINDLSDGSVYAADSFGNTPDGTIFSKCDLTINGAGTLNVNGSYKFGIIGKDDVVIVGATLNVTAKTDGIAGKNSVSIGSGTVSVIAGGDGVVSVNDDDATLGSVLIDGGTITIMTGGANAESSKGIKAQTSLAINGGSVTIDAEDDALHSANSLTITNGTLLLSSGDDGMHSDDVLAVSGGEVTISKSYEGIEGGAITISGGIVQVTSSDDGFNAGGGADGSASGGPRGNDSFAADSSKSLVITGGSITVNAQGDGLDSNGTLSIEGGTICVSGPTNSGNGALDGASTTTISGGVVIAAGSAGMAQGFDQTSSQLSISYTFASAQAAGTAITLKDASGNTVVTYSPEKTFQNVIISAPDLSEAESYTLYAGSSLVDTITLTGTVTSIGSSGMDGGFSGGQKNGGRHG